MNNTIVVVVPSIFTSSYRNWLEELVHTIWVTIVELYIEILCQVPEDALSCILPELDDFIDKHYRR